MKDFPTAEEAYIATNRNIEQCISNKLEELRVQIEQAISDGKYSITGEGTLDSNVVYWLGKNNYKVTLDSQYNQSYWIISWDKKNENNIRILYKNM